MEFLALLLDFILHVDRYLNDFVLAYGTWIYVLLFVIIFVETGLVVMPFLPGDSLLFIVGAMCGTGMLDLQLSIGLMVLAAVAGNQTNYTIGRFFGPKVFQWENSRFFNRAAFDKAHEFYERHGGVALVIGRFMPFVRTFAPFVAGAGGMSYGRFQAYNVVGGGVWTASFLYGGYFFGNLPFVKQNFSLVILAIIVLSLMPGVVEYWRQRRTVAEAD